MPPIIDIDTTLDASGGSNDTVTRAYQIHDDSGLLHVVLSGASTSADVFVETRGAEDMDWADYLSPTTGADPSAGYVDVTGIDLEDVPELRLRIVNQDGTNTADVRAVVRMD
jgi:hypothetical protein